MLLEFLLQHRQQNPEFRFWLRQRDQGDALNNGYWFEGNDNYIFVSFWNHSSGANMTRSMGFVIYLETVREPSTGMEVLLDGETDEKVIALYKEIIGRFQLERDNGGKYKKLFPVGDVFKSLTYFINEVKPTIDAMIQQAGKEEMFISEDDFKHMLSATSPPQAGHNQTMASYLDQLLAYGYSHEVIAAAANVEGSARGESTKYTPGYMRGHIKYRQMQQDRRQPQVDATPELTGQGDLGIIMANITWNSNDWQSPSVDKSNHRWVNEGNTPMESWNFDFENRRNPADKVYGFCQFVAAPLIDRAKKIIIFYSQGKVVGFYGKAEVLRNPITLPNGEQYNLIGDKSLSLVLQNKLDNLKARGYLEEKQRMGQNGFIYLRKRETVLSMLDEAIKLNPQQSRKLADLKAWIEGDTKPEPKKEKPMDTALNQIFFGPPGTGKTYSTVEEAIKIVDREFYQRNYSDRHKLKERFRELLITDWQNNQGQIAFCTFHQSFSYEDFVEGIKPVSPDEGASFLKYRVEDGIFKRICRLSEDHQKSARIKTERVLFWNEEMFDEAVFYKISLGNSNKEDDQAIYEYCIRNNCIALGYGDEHDFTGLDEEQITARCNELGKESFSGQALNRFIHYLKPGNYVLVSNGNRYIRAIGRVTGPYHYNPNTSIRYRHFRPVEWLVADEEIPITELYDRSLSQQTLYKLDEDGIKKEFFIHNGQPEKTEEKEGKNFVLIIDEVNRGNVSSIFGELITLIEKDKRAGEREELTATLPYSKEMLKVPNNVYIIGTMNTADRSIEALDTALRRRFSFREMPSIPDLIRTEGASKGRIGLIDVVQMLTTINERIEKLIDKDHKIGHAYFMEDKTDKDLITTFHNKVIPLLQEYFFGDFGKIGLVLGDSFIEKLDTNHFKFANFKGYDNEDSIADDLKARPVYRIKNQDQWNFISIYE